MDEKYAAETESSLRGKAGRWKSSRHLAFSVLRKGIERSLGGELISCVEIYLSSPSPVANSLHGIVEVDERGVWCYDGDGHIDEECLFRKYLIPWNIISGIIVHRAT